MSYTSQCRPIGWQASAQAASIKSLLTQTSTSAWKVPLEPIQFLLIAKTARNRKISRTTRERDKSSTAPNALTITPAATQTGTSISLTTVPITPTRNFIMTGQPGKGTSWYLLSLLLQSPLLSSYKHCHHFFQALENFSGRKVLGLVISWAEDAFLH